MKKKNIAVVFALLLAPLMSGVARAENGYSDRGVNDARDMLGVDIDTGWATSRSKAGSLRQNNFTAKTASNDLPVSAAGETATVKDVRAMLRVDSSKNARSLPVLKKTGSIISRAASALPNINPGSGTSRGSSLLGRLNRH